MKNKLNNQNCITVRLSSIPATFFSSKLRLTIIYLYVQSIFVRFKSYV